MKRFTYKEIPAAEVPDRCRFDTPRQNQGQIVLISYSDARPGAYEQYDGSTYKREEDQSFPEGHPERVTYYKKST